MVNELFLSARPYGFEMVDARTTAILSRISASIENLHRIKSVGFSANFRRINLNANTCDLSTAVKSGLIARDQAQRDQKSF
jgi:hypothetical protein